jgi:NAD(P)-dependent dehydrogenase (short-subunit alcohol dehydrogenase family)
MGFITFDPTPISHRTAPGSPEPLSPSSVWDASAGPRLGRLDVAVNNAGTEGKFGPVTEQSADSYAATFDTNVLGTVLSISMSCV